MDVTSLSAMAAAFFVVAVAPGPATLGCASVAMSQGRRAGLGFGFGLGLALLFWGVLAAIGLGAILAASAQVMLLLKLLGGCYLLWLAWKAGRSAVAGEVSHAAEVTSGRWIWRGALLNLSNPKAVFAWLATLSLGVGPEDSLATVIVATLICGVIGFIVYLPWVFGFSHPRVMRGYQRVRRWVDGAVAALFAAAGLGLIRSAFARVPN